MQHDECSPIHEQMTLRSRFFLVNHKFTVERSSPVHDRMTLGVGSF